MIVVMKNIIIAISAALACVACSDFLNIRPEGTTPSEGLDYSVKDNVFKPVSAAYASMRSSKVHALPYICAFEITSDNADKGSSPEDNPTAQALDDFTLDASNTIVNELWEGYFDVVSAANNAIIQMPLFDAAIQDAQTKVYIRQCESEARTIRAYAYFNLLRMFGRVPVVDTLLTSEQLASLKQAETEDLYEFIEKDLDYAIERLPASYPKSDAGRITSYTAMAIKAKAMMYKGDWEEVARLTDSIIASGKYSLLPVFRMVFSMDGENSVESLFEIQSSTLGNVTGSAPYMEYAYVQGPRGNTPSNMQGWGFCTPSEDLIEFYRSRNEYVRPAATLLYRGTVTPEGDEIKESCTNPVYNGKVYTPSVYNNWSYNGYGFDHNVRILRYSDVLLMYAEARLNGALSGTESGLTADDAVTLVRERAGLEKVEGLTLEDVWDERRAEFALEEDRFFDLIRTGQAESVLASKGFVQGRNNLLPIPANQRQLNQNLIQNPGY